MKVVSLTASKSNNQKRVGTFAVLATTCMIGVAANAASVAENNWEIPPQPSPVVTVIEDAKYETGVVPYIAAAFPVGRSLAKQASFSYCAAGATACGFSAAGFALACGADAAAVISSWFFPPAAGAVPALTAGCLQTFAATGGVCSTAMGICVPGNGTYNPSPTRRLSTLHGADYGTNTSVTDQKCPGNHRVNRVLIEQSGTNGGASYLRRIQMRCTDGSVISAGYDGAGGNTGSYTCGTGDLVHGLRIRSGSYVDAVGVNCRQAGWKTTSSPVPHDSTQSPLMGGNGGTLRTANCNNDEYVHGFRAEWYTTAQNQYNAYIHHIKLDCK